MYHDQAFQSISFFASVFDLIFKIYFSYISYTSFSIHTIILYVPDFFLVTYEGFCFSNLLIDVFFGLKCEYMILFLFDVQFANFLWQ